MQNGKFSAPMPALVSALKSVDLPTFGRPTMPQLKPMIVILNKMVSKKSAYYIDKTREGHAARLGFCDVLLADV
ncbi:hypothetical protein A3750_17295 [Oleiphilus sp. HI0079]|nr:hypothetical protein A3750_17295 [Oleiphilus sp. HI0079]